VGTKDFHHMTIKKLIKSCIMIGTEWATTSWIWASFAWCLSFKSAALPKLVLMSTGIWTILCIPCQAWVWQSSCLMSVHHINLTLFPSSWENAIWTVRKEHCWRNLVQDVRGQGGEDLQPHLSRQMQFCIGSESENLLKEYGSDWWQPF
jgi:hypothetical protein